MKYIFILGQSSDLAKQEIINLTNTQPELSDDNFALFAIQQTPDELMPKLGGTIKIAKFLGEINNLDKLTIDKYEQICLNIVRSFASESRLHAVLSSNRD